MVVSPSSRLQATLNRASSFSAFLLLFLLLAACSNEGAGGGNQTPTARPPLAVDELRAVVPPGWSLDDWAISQDGAYVVLATTGPERVPGLRSSVVSVYRRNDATLVEVARLLACCERERFEPLRANDILAPDDSGTRRLSLEQHYGTQQATAAIAIEASGKVTIGQDRAPAGTPVIEGTEVADPLASVDVMTEPLWGGPSWVQVPGTPTPQAATVLAGAIPVGWKVSQAVWSEDRQYLAVVTFQGIDSQLSVYGLAGGQLHELWRELNRVVTLDESLTFKDINGDGDLDIVYNTGTGGNGWTMWPTLAASLTADGRIEDVPFQLPIKDSSPTRPVDLDGDGIYEWLAIDASWELRCFSHATSPGSWFVLAWDGQEYVDATERYPEAVDDQRLKDSGSIGSGELDPVSPPPGASDREKGGYLSASVSRFLDYFNSRRSDDAKRILNSLREYRSFGRFSAARDWIVETLARNPHPSYREPMPTGVYCP